MALALVATLFAGLAVASPGGASGVDDTSAPRDEASSASCHVDAEDHAVLHEGVHARVTRPDAASSHETLSLVEAAEGADDFERLARVLTVLAIAREASPLAEPLAPRESKVTTPRHASIGLRALRGPPHT
ncbi:MAG: hypothetical protein MUE69_07475 [Myxococcota bacterium]|jgi:hypothetical protein|nr:hypothetical protein [Myxococcota bacterium]